MLLLPQDAAQSLLILKLARFPIWVQLKQVAVETNRTIYRVKHDLLDDYLCQQLKAPTIQMCLA